MMVNLRDRERERTCVSCWLFGFQLLGNRSAMSLVYGIMYVFYSCMFSIRIIIDCFT